MRDLPTGTVIFLFSDIEGSTRLLQDVGEVVYNDVLTEHRRVLRAAFAAHNGIEIGTEGDSFLVAFAQASDAVMAALNSQRNLQGTPVRVRMGLHAGEPLLTNDGYVGMVVHRAARISAMAFGGQVLVSEAVARLVDDLLPVDVGLRDLGHIQLKDLARPERVYQVLHSDLCENFPPLRSLAKAPNNLPHQLASFIGRETQIEELKRLLRATRLLTLTGAGGCGKTRLALQLSNQLFEVYPEGLWLVELAPLVDPDYVPHALASVLGIREQAGKTVTDSVVETLNRKHLLLILDNAEHLIDACARLVEILLRQCATLTILVTSREPLRIAGEVSYRVPSLSMPKPEDDNARDQVLACESARLFVERARLQQPQFQVTTSAHAGALGSICRRLDGIPLAIELAAVCVRSMSLTRIAMRLDDRFQLLTGGYRTALPRQQTLRALIDWSYELLDDDERAVLRRLAAFAGGWTVEAADAVASGQNSQASDVFDVLTRLVEKSLVVVDAGAERYHLLDTIAEYALQRLDEEGETPAIRECHREYFVAYAERAFPQLFGDEQSTWLAFLDGELDNILAAHASCGSDPSAGALDLRLVHAIKPYYYNRGLLGLALQITTEALEHRGSAERNFLRCRGLFDAGQLCSFMGLYATAQTYLQESLAIAREIGDRQRVAAVLQPLGMVALGQGDTTAAHGYLSEALTMAREIGIPREVAAALNALAQYHRVIDELEISETLYRQVRTMASELGDRETTAIALLNLAMVTILQGGSVEARRILAESLTIVDELGSHPLGQSVIEVSAGLAALREEWGKSTRFFGIAEAHAKRIGIRRDAVDEAFLAPLVQRAHDALGIHGFASAEAAGSAIPYEDGIEEVRNWLNSSAPPTMANS